MKGIRVYRCYCSAAIAKSGCWGSNIDTPEEVVRLLSLHYVNQKDFCLFIILGPLMLGFGYMKRGPVE